MLDTSLIKNLHKFQDAHEAQLYLDFVGDLLFDLNLKSDDLRFHFNPTKNGRFFLPLTINNRYIVCKGRNLDEPTWWLIHPGLAYIEDDADYDYFTFAHKRHDLPEGGPLMRRYPLSIIKEQRDKRYSQVLECARRDLQACKSTPQRISHNTLAYACACDEATRQQLLAMVWPHE